MEKRNGRRGTALMEEVASEFREGEVKECKGGGRVKKMSNFCKTYERRRERTELARGKQLQRIRGGNPATDNTAMNI